MGLEQEQGYLKVDRWYYEYTKKEFIELAQKYPNIPFYVETGIKQAMYYRWNSENNVLECMDVLQRLFGCWKPGSLKIKRFIEGKEYLSFIVLSDILSSAICNEKQSIEIILNVKGQDLVPRKNLRTIGSTQIT